MSELIFIYNQNPVKIPFKANELMRDIIERFCSKVHAKSSDLYFLSNGKIIEPNKKVDDEFKSDLISKVTIKILAYSNKEEISTQDFKISTEIICPQCNESCQIEVKNYKITFSSCKNGHTIKDVSFSDINDKLKVDESKIVCNFCKNNNKASTYNNKFYICITCKKYICPFCKSAHDKKHDIIDFEQKNYVCFNHNEKFNSYCKNCKINLCMECEAEHKDRQNLIYFRDILPNKEQYISKLNDLKTKIDKYKEKINEIKNILDKIITNLETYYQINDNLLNEYDQKKKNYHILYNIKELEKYNNKIISDLNSVTKNKEFSKIIQNSMEIMNKMDFKFNGKNVQPFSDKELKESGEKKIKELYENFIINDLGKSNNSGNSFDKLVYSAMLAEQCTIYEDMFYFLKGYIKKRKGIINADERNLFLISCKMLISKYRNACRTISAYENKEKQKNNSSFLPYILEYKNIMENTLYEKCSEIITFINNNIIKSPNFFRDYDVESKVHFYKMIGDYHKYSCESEQFKTKEIEQTNLYYNEASKIAINLQFLNSVNLGLILNISVFTYEMLNDKKKAIELVKSTLEKFKKEEKNLTKVQADEQKDIMALIQLMKENLALWEGK